MDKLQGSAHATRHAAEKMTGEGSGRIVWVFIEGVIGVGKSTTIDNVKQVFDESQYNIIMVKEPVDSWTRPVAGGDSLLDALYEDNEKLERSAFQILAATQRFTGLINAFYEAQILVQQTPVRDVIVVSERSIIGDNIFAAINLVNNDLSQAMYSMALKAHLNVIRVQFKCIQPYVIVLMPHEDTIVKRIKSRGRECETPLIEHDRANSYLRKLINMHKYIFKNETSYEPLLDELPNFRTDRVLLIDNSSLTPCETAERIKRFTTSMAKY